MAKQHGIDREKANKEIQRFIELREEYTKPEILSQLSPAAQTFLNSGTISFGFDRAQIENLFSSVEGNSYRIYLAVDLESGFPTLIVLPSDIDDSTSLASNKIAPGGNPGRQYPYVYKTRWDKSTFDIGNE